MRTEVFCPTGYRGRCAFPVACPRFNLCRRYQVTFRRELGYDGDMTTPEPRPDEEYPDIDVETMAEALAAMTRGQLLACMMYLSGFAPNAYRRTMAFVVSAEPVQCIECRKWITRGQTYADHVAKHLE